MSGLYLPVNARLSRSSGFFSLSSAFTISIWVKRPDVETEQDNTIFALQQVLDMMGPPGDKYLWIGWTYTQYPTEKIGRATLGVQMGDGSAPFLAKVVTVTSYVHVGLVSDGSTITGYYGLCPIGTLTVDAFTPVVMQMGAATQDFDLDGLKELSLYAALRHFRIWQRALTATELRAEAESSTVVDSTDLWADYPFATGTDTTDASGNGRDWTVSQGTPTTASGDPDYAPPGCLPIAVPLSTPSAPQIQCAPRSSVGNGGRGPDPKW